MAEINGFHVFSIPTAVKDLSLGIRFSELENELGGGYYAQILYGSENGERFWSLTLPTLTGSSMDGRTAVGINGETLSYEEYIWDLFCEQKVSGSPFAFQDTRSGNYYLARFANSELTYGRMLTKLYSTGLELKQWRISGESVYQPGEIDQVVGSYAGDGYAGGFVGWSDSSGVIGALAGTGDVAKVAVGDYFATQFNLTTNDGFVVGGLAFTVREVILLMRMREATFSNTAGIISGDVAPNNVFLAGASGTTKFFDFGFGVGYTYKLNGIEYAENDQQAPMNEWGIVHARYELGVPLTTLQMGKDRDFAGRFAEADIGYAVIASALIPKSTQREIYELLSILKAKLEA